MINASQVLAIGVTLHLIEEAVEDIERPLSAASARTTYRLVDDLTPAERETIHTSCSQAREALGGQPHEYGPRSRSTRSDRNPGASGDGLGDAAGYQE